MSAADDMDREDEATGAGAERPPAAEEAAGKESAKEQAAAGEPTQAAASEPRARKRLKRKRPASKGAAAKEAQAADETASAEELPATTEPTAEAGPAAEAESMAEAESAAEAEPADEAEPAAEGPVADPRPKAAETEEAEPGEEDKPAEDDEPGRAAKVPPSPGKRGLVGRRKRGKRAPRRRVVRARARYVRTSARKARMVCGHLRGKSVQEARAILAFTPREVAGDWSKLLESAVANAESNHELLEDDLIIREAYADEGPTIKRFRPRAMGRATSINKRTSHLTIALTTVPEPARTTKRRS